MMQLQRGLRPIDQAGNDLAGSRIGGLLDHCAEISRLDRKPSCDASFGGVCQHGSLIFVEREDELLALRFDIQNSIDNGRRNDVGLCDYNFLAGIPIAHDFCCSPANPAATRVGKNCIAILESFYANFAGRHPQIRLYRDETARQERAISVRVVDSVEARA